MTSVALLKNHEYNEPPVPLMVSKVLDYDEKLSWCSQLENNFVLSSQGTDITVWPLMNFVKVHASPLPLNIIGDCFSRESFDYCQYSSTSTVSECVEFNSLHIYVKTRHGSSVELSENAAKVLGENGCARFYEFLNYEDGWCGGDSRAIAKNSIDIMEKFFENYSEFCSEPSLFLGFNGNLIVGWEDCFDNRIELEFGENRIHYYVASAGAEGTLLNDSNFEELLKILRK